MRAARAARIGARAGRLSRVGVPQDVSMAEGRKEHGKVWQNLSTKSAAKLGEDEANLTCTFLN